MHSRGLPAPDGDRSPDDLLAALADRRRREILRHLRERPEASLGSLRWILAERLGPVESADRRAGMAYHRDLPKLDAAGLVDFEPSSGHVRRREWPAVVGDVLDRVD